MKRRRLETPSQIADVLIHIQKKNRSYMLQVAGEDYSHGWDLEVTEMEASWLRDVVKKTVEEVRRRDKPDWVGVRVNERKKR
jgi:hypothetical protein